MERHPTPGGRPWIRALAIACAAGSLGAPGAVGAAGERSPRAARAATLPAAPLPSVPPFPGAVDASCTEGPSRSCYLFNAGRTADVLAHYRAFAAANGWTPRETTLTDLEDEHVLLFSRPPLLVRVDVLANPLTGGDDVFVSVGPEPPPDSSKGGRPEKAPAVTPAPAPAVAPEAVPQPSPRPAPHPAAASEGTP